MSYWVNELVSDETVTRDAYASKNYKIKSVSLILGHPVVFFTSIWQKYEKVFYIMYGTEVRYGMAYRWYLLSYMYGVV